jgi:hypothetical protein
VADAGFDLPFAIGIADTNNVNQSKWLTSFIYGGGVRLAFNDSTGLRVALEGVTVSPIKANPTTPRANYGRFLVGVFVLSKARQVPPTSPAPRLAVSDSVYPCAIA